MSRWRIISASSETKAGNEANPKAFVFAYTTKEASGGVLNADILIDSFILAMVIDNYQVN